MSKIAEATDRLRSRFDANVAAEATGFFGTSLAIGAFGNRLPANIAGLDTKLVLGGGAYFMSMRKKRSKQGAMMRGAAYSLLGEYVQGLGASLGANIGGGVGG